MWEFFRQVFDPDFMPHGQCYLWQPGVLWSNVISDGFIFLAYALIPLSIAYAYKKRPDLVIPHVALLFITFITACGLTHLVSVWNVWHGAYWLSGIVKAFTAVVSVATAVVLFWLMPQILKIPTVGALEEQVRARDEAVDTLEMERAQLRENVAARTAALEMKNKELMVEKQRLEAFQDVALEREERMVELKQEVNELLQALGRPPRFVLKAAE